MRIGGDEDRHPHDEHGKGAEQGAIGVDETPQAMAERMSSATLNSPLARKNLRARQTGCSIGARNYVKANQGAWKNDKHAAQ